MDSISITIFPDFIKKYIDCSDFMVKDAADKFEKAITKYNVEKHSFGEKSKFLITGIEKDDYDVINFLDLFFNLTALDCRYNCIYEDELGIPKTTSNELFIIDYKQSHYIVYIENFNNNILTFSTI